MNTATSSRRRGRPARPVRARLQVELLESRDVPSTFNLTPLVQVSSTSPFDGNPIEANDPAFARNAEVEPYVAVDPTNPKHLVGAWIQDFARGIVAAVSFNGGNTWQAVVIPGATLASGGTYPHASDPWVSFAPNGDMYLSLIGHDLPPEGDAILVSKSTDGGLTWGAPTTLVTAGSKEFHDKESVTADPTNPQFAYAAWTRFHSGKGTAMFSRTTDGGQTWEPARAILDLGGNNVSEYFQIVVLPDGTLLNFFVQQTYKNDAGGIDHFDFQVSLIRSSDHGQTWQPAPSPVADVLPLNDTLNIPGARGVPNPDGGLGIDAHNWSFDVALDPANGNLYAVWQDARFSNFQYTSIAFSMSTDGGFTWSAPIKINQTPDNIPAGNRQAFLPSVAVNEDGVVAVTYFDFRNNTPAPGLPTDLWMVHANPADGFINWSSENQMTPASFNIENAGQRAGYFIGDYQGLVAEGKNFGAFFSMPTATDSGSIFFRDPLPADPAANVNTDTEGDVHNETTLAVNPTNPLNLVGSSNEYEVAVLGNGQLHFTAYPSAHVTFDGGQTWANYPIPFHGYNSVFDPSVSFDADGTAYFAAVARVHAANFQHSSELDTADDIIVSHSTDGGRTWSAPVRVARGTGANGDKVRETDNDKEYVAAWGHGNAIVTWSQANWGPQGQFINKPVLASVTHDGGNTWTTPVPISGPLGFFAVPTVAADGSIYVAYWSFDDEVAPQFRDHYVVVKVDPATGQALGAPVEVGLIYDGVNDYPQSIQGNYTYQDSQFTSWPTGNIAADPTNALHLAVIWSDMRNNPYPDAVLPSLDPYQVQTNSDIIISQSFDGGAHWSAPTAIATPNDQFQPWGAYDAAGRLQIGYYDRSYDPANHQYGYTLASETVPGALIFTVQQVTTALSDPTQGDAFLPVTVNSNFPNATLGIGDYSGIAVTPTGVAALWTDLRLPSTIPAFPGSGEDAFFALVGPPALLAAASAPGTSSTLTSNEVAPILAEAIARWAAAGVDTAALGSVQVVLTNLPGAELGAASGHTIYLDSNAAGWGWFIDPTPHDDSEFTTPGNQGEMNRMDLLTVLEHELGHVLGFGHTASGVMAETLPPGTRCVPPFGSDLGDLALLDQVFADSPVAQAW